MHTHTYTHTHIQYYVYIYISCEKKFEENSNIYWGYFRRKSELQRRKVFWNSDDRWWKSGANKSCLRATANTSSDNTFSMSNCSPWPIKKDTHSRRLCVILCDFQWFLYFSSVHGYLHVDAPPSIRRNVRVMNSESH